MYICQLEQTYFLSVSKKRCNWVNFIALIIEGGVYIGNFTSKCYHVAMELVNELPSLTKAVGTAMETLAKGSFRIKGTGEKCILFLNPQNEQFLRFEVDGQIYYISGATDEETKMIYEKIMSK